MCRWWSGPGCGARTGVPGLPIFSDALFSASWWVRLLTIKFSGLHGVRFGDNGHRRQDLRRCVVFRSWVHFVSIFFLFFLPRLDPNRIFGPEAARWTALACERPHVSIQLAKNFEARVFERYYSEEKRLRANYASRKGDWLIHFRVSGVVS
jgi:hypothetical protein